MIVLRNAQECACHNVQPPVYRLVQEDAPMRAPERVLERAAADARGRVLWYAAETAPEHVPVDVPELVR